jgi:hypothetical protein
MNKLIKGENLRAQLFITDTYFDIFCAKSVEFSIEQDELEVTSILSGSSREYLPGMMNATLTTSGVSTIDNTEGKIAITYLMQQSIRRQLQQWRVYFEADDGDTLEATFSGMIRNTTISRDGFAYNQSNLVVRISGDIEFNEIIDPPSTDFDLISDYWLGPNTQNYISGVSEVNTYTLEATDEILQVDLEGTQYDLVTGVPSVGKRECRFTTSPQRITFPSDIIFTGVERIYVLIKRPI